MADSVPVIIAAGAVAKIIGPSGMREEPVENIVMGPGQTSLADGEFIVSFSFLHVRRIAGIAISADATHRDGHRSGRCRRLAA